MPITAQACKPIQAPNFIKQIKQTNGGKLGVPKTDNENPFTSLWEYDTCGDGNNTNQHSRKANWKFAK